MNPHVASALFGDPVGGCVSETRLGMRPYHYAVSTVGTSAWRGAIDRREYSTFTGPRAADEAAAWCKGAIA